MDKCSRLGNRKCLGEATARYFDLLAPEIIAEENAIAKDLMSCGSAIDFDHEI